jgi:hypothetical protein
MPEGFAWCGGCGQPTRSLTGDEMADLLLEAARLVERRSGDARAVFREIGWAAEMHARSAAVCMCPPPPFWRDAPRNGFHLYRLWAADGRLLYVGVSTVLRQRLRRHERTYGDLIARATWQEHEDERSMLAAELEAIRSEDPALNKAGV